jgi:uncharacterized protein YgiM (DUF1202 family)
MLIATTALLRTASAMAVIVCLSAEGPLAAGQARSKQPVLIGGAESAEGCAGTATVAVRDGSTLNLRSGPGAGYPVIARLQPGQAVSICQSPGNGWLGVVVHRTSRGFRDCGLSDAGSRAKPYAGPCDSGWVREQFLRLQAG